MASKVPLLPSLNRNLSQIIDVNESGLVAYGWRSSICIYNFRTSIPEIVDSKLINNAHRGKVLSVSFCKSNNELIASIGEDNFVRVWDLETETCIANMEVKEGTRVVEWLYGNSTSVTFPGTISLVCKWNYARNNLVHIKTGSDSFIYSLSSNKKSPELLAVGHSVGTISILNMDTQVLMHKLKAHVMEITSLSWSPVSPTLLLSTSSDQTARVWKLGEYKPIRTFNYPKSRKMEDKKYPIKLCGIFHPENSDVIICSNVRGCLGEVTFKENESAKFAAYDEKNSGTNFKCVNIMIPYLAENNKTLLLTSDYLKISLFDISEKKLLSSFSYLNGNIYDLAASILHPHLLAISSGDGCLRIWNLNESPRLDMTTIVIYTRIKIMTLAWHPTAEGIIAYGTDEGRVGIADINRKKSLYSFETHHSNCVYSMQWAPCLKIKDSEEDFFLYSCGGGAIYIYELHKANEKPADFDDLITFPPDLELVQKTHSELSWKSDYTCLIIGSFKGFCDLFDNKLNFLTRVTMQMKIIESVKWHPRYTFTSTKGSDYSSWFAAAGNDDNIQIFDTSDIKNSEPESALCRPTKTLIGHKKKISSLCWSPHTDGYMASASRDGTVLVWNVITTTIIANYACHKDIVYAVHWSYLDPDTIYSGGMDCCLRVWKISEQTHSAAPEKSQVVKRKPRFTKPKEHNRKESHSVEGDSSCRELCGSRNSINESPKELEISKIEEISNAEDSSNRLKAKLDLKEYKKKLFTGYMSRPKEKKLENIIKLTDLLSQPLETSDPENMTLISDIVTDEESLYCGLYCDQLTAVKMLETKAKAENSIGITEKFCYLQLMANNVEPLLINAAENKKLTDFLMAAAITVSRKFYNEMCKKYAMQLIEEKNYMKASMYLLFCGELHSAVKSLLEKAKILEALALAKARLPADDPFIRGALLKASNHFSSYHQFENEAECYLALKEPSEAAKTLYRSDDSSAMYVSAYICKKFNLIEEAESYGYFCMEKCLADAAWPIFYKLINLIDSLKVYKLLVRVHELIFTQIKTLKKDGISSNKLFGVTGSRLPIWENKAFGDSNISFLPFVYDVLISENIIPEDKESLEEIRNALDSMIAKRQKYETSEEAHINLAIFFSQVIVSSLLNDFSVVQKYFFKVFPAVYNVVFLPRVAFCLFLPFDIHWCSNKDAFICENKYLESQSLSFLHLQNIYASLYDKFASLNASAVEDFSISQAFSSNLDDAVEQVISALSKKTSEDSFILYFSICYITELRMLAKHGWKFRCYDNVISCDKNAEKVVPEVGNLSIVCDKRNSENNTTYNTHKNIEEHDESKVICTESAGQNVLGKLKLEDDITTQNNVANDLSSQYKDNIHLNNFSPSPPLLLEEINLTVSSCSIPSLVEENNLTASSCSIPPLVAENNLTVSSSSVTVEDNVKNSENASAVSSSMFRKIKDFLISSDNNGDMTEKNLTKNVNDENEISSTEKMKDEVSPAMENGEIDEKETMPESTTDKTEENVKLSSPEYINKTVEIEGISSEADDDHLQCWSDISLYYILTKCFTSLNCRDEYALFFYLQKYLHYMDGAIADIARQQSTKLVLNNPNELPSVIKEKSLLNQNNISNDLVEVEKDCQENLIISSSLKSAETSDSPKGNDSRDNYDSSILEREKKIEVDENQVKSSLSISSNEKSELTDETNIKTPNQGEDSTNAVLHEKLGLTQESTVSENLQLEHGKVSQLVKLLNSVEFDYPNPFDAVSAINGLCCDIFRKNPCNFVRKKFHEFAHEVNKWNAKFCLKDETVKCDICKETICI